MTSARAEDGFRVSGVTACLTTLVSGAAGGAFVVFASPSAAEDGAAGDSRATCGAPGSAGFGGGGGAAVSVGTSSALAIRSAQPAPNAKLTKPTPSTAN